MFQQLWQGLDDRWQGQLAAVAASATLSAVEAALSVRRVFTVASGNTDVGFKLFIFAQKEDNSNTSSLLLEKGGGVQFFGQLVGTFRSGGIAIDVTVKDTATDVTVKDTAADGADLHDFLALVRSALEHL